MQLLDAEIVDEVHWCPEPESNRHEVALEGFSYHYGFRHPG